MIKNAKMISPSPSGTPRLGEAHVSDLLIGQIRECLGETCPYSRAFRDIAIENQTGIIRLRGRVGSFYLKQVLQTYVAKVDGVKQVENCVEVMSS